MINEELKAAYLDINKPFVKDVKYQKYYTCSMLTPNLFPFDKRERAKETNVYGFKLHGVYETYEEQTEHSEKLRNTVKNYEILGDKIGELVEFDVDLADTKRNSKIIYKEEEQNEINARQFKSEISEEYFENNEVFNFEKDINNNNEESFVENDVENVDCFKEKNEMLVWKIKEAKFGCVSFYTKELKNLSEAERGKEIVAHIVHGFFDKYDDAKKFVYSKRNKYPLIFIFQVGYWCAFDKVLLNNLNCSKDKLIDRNYKLNEYMKYYMDCLENTAMEEKIRRDEYLKDATVVTDECKHLKNNLNKTEKKNHEEKNNEVQNDENNMNNLKKEEISEEDKIKNKLEEIRLMKEQLNDRLIDKTNVSEEEMENKFQKMRDLYEMLQK